MKLQGLMGRIFWKLYMPQWQECIKRERKKEKEAREKKKKDGVVGSIFGEWNPPKF